MYEWPDRPHEPVTYVRVRARVTNPAPGAVIPAGTYTVRGKAWSGTGPVTGVEVSLAGGGEDWKQAKVEPAAGATLSPGTCTVRGKAWSGTRPVTRVEVSLTGEGEWHAATLAPPTGPYHWQSWSFDWDAGDVGRHTLRARATDAAGNVQPEVPPWNRLGYGNNAIEVIYVDVTA